VAPPGPRQHASGSDGLYSPRYGAVGPWRGWQLAEPGCHSYRRALALSLCCAPTLEIARGRRSRGQFWRYRLGPERCIGRHGSTRVGRFEVRPNARKPGLRGRDLASLVLQLSRRALSQRGEAPRRVHGRPIGPTSQARNCCLGSWLQRVRLHGAGRIVLEAGTVNPGPLLALLQQVP
jgi:hypothetical protein